MRGLSTVAHQEANDEDLGSERWQKREKTWDRGAWNDDRVTNNKKHQWRGDDNEKTVNTVRVEGEWR